ncbi:exosortase E/protease, VPEID-CTERM system [Novosphingobium jiangmenense]|nr:exosortase E/protease, VPEID-CTERM system [Novosphingobium jiangmenense]
MNWRGLLPPLLVLSCIVPAYLVWHANFENRITPTDGLHPVLLLKYAVKSNVVVLAALYFLTRFTAGGSGKSYGAPTRGQWMALFAVAVVAFCVSPSLLCAAGTCKNSIEGTEAYLAVPLLLVLIMAWTAAFSLATPATYFRAPRIVYGYAGFLWLIIAAQQNVYDLLSDRVYFKILSLTISISSAIIEALSGTRPWISQASADSYPIMHLGDFSVRIAPSCAGAQGIALCCGLLTLYMVSDRARLRLARASVLLVLACITVFLSNALRIALLILIGKSYSPEIAVGGFHSHFGLLASLAVTFIFLWLMQLSWFSRAPIADRAEKPASDAVLVDRSTASRPDFTLNPLDVILLLPLAGFLLAGMVLGLASSEFNWLYPLQACIGLLIVWQFRAVIRAEIAMRIKPADILGGVLVYVLWLALVPHDAERSLAMEQALDAAPPLLAAGWIAMRLLGATLLTPLFEELAFRGGLQRMAGKFVSVRGYSQVSALIAISASTLAFAAMHGDFWAAVFAGLVYGALALRSRSVAPAFYAHGITNFLLSVQAIALGQWSYW